MEPVSAGSALAQDYMMSNALAMVLTTYVVMGGRMEVAAMTSQNA